MTIAVIRPAVGETTYASKQAIIRGGENTAEALRQANRAQQFAVATEADADRSEGAADTAANYSLAAAALTAGSRFADYADGISGTSAGEMFYVASGGYFRFYINGTSVDADDPVVLMGGNYARALYVDSGSGLDTNSGMTPDAPLQTLAAAKVIAAAQGGPITIHPVAGSVFREDGDFSANPYATIEGVGDLSVDGLPVCRGDDLITETLTADGNAYGYTYDYSFDLNQQAKPPHLYEDGALMAWVADLATCKTTPGSFTHDATTTDVTGVQVWFHPSDSGNPASNGMEYSHTVRTWAWKVGNFGKTRLVKGMNAAHDNGAINGGDNCLAELCLVVGSPIHDILLASGVMRNCIAWHPYNDSRTGSIAMEFYRPDGDGHSGIFEDCVVVGPDGGGITAFGGHVAGGLSDGSNLYDQMLAIDCAAYGGDFNFDDAKVLRAERVKTVEGYVRWVFFMDGGKSTIVDPETTCSIVAGGIRGMGPSQAGIGTLDVDGARIYQAGSSTAQLVAAVTSLTNSVIVSDVNGDAEFVRSPTDLGTDMVIRGNVFAHRGTGSPKFYNISRPTADLDFNDNIFIGEGTFVVNGSTYSARQSLEAGTGLDADSITNLVTTGADLIADSGAQQVNTGWTENGDGTWTQDGSGNGAAARLQFLAIAGFYRFTFTNDGPGSVDVRDGATTFVTNLGPGTHVINRIWTNNVSILPKGAATVISAVSLLALEKTDLDPKNPASGDFRMVGDVGSTLAGTLRPVTYHRKPATLAEAEAMILGWM